MIVSCVSGKQHFVSPGGKDYSAASFRVLFDEPLELKNCDIELISCKISRLNQIVIPTDGATLSVRMGLDSFAEQYVAKVPAGVYEDADKLGDAIAAALNEIMPMNQYKGQFSATVGGSGEIIMGFTPQASPTTALFKTVQTTPALVTAVSDAQLLPQAAIAPPSMVANHEEYQCTDALQAEIRSNVLVPGVSGAEAPGRVRGYGIDDFDYCGGIDAGTLQPEKISQKSWSEYGVWEGRRGYVEAVLRPVNCVVRSSYDAGFSGFDPGGSPTHKPSYWTFDFGETLNDDGSLVDGLFRYGSMFARPTLSKNQPRVYDGIARHQLNGCLMRAVPAQGADPRGSPYNISKQLHMPYSLTTPVAQYTAHRRLAVATTWTGQIMFNRAEGRDYDIVTGCPKNYSYQMNGTAPATSLVRRHGQHTETVRVRMTNGGLMQGLPQQQVLNGPVVDTSITGANILATAQVPPAGYVLQYIVGSVGRMNSYTGAAAMQGAIRNTNIQCRLPGGQDDGASYAFKYPYYRIIEVDAQQLPTRVVLMDSGEHVIPFTDQDSTLWLNDESTFRVVPGEAFDPDPDVVLLGQCFRVLPTLGEIMYPTPTPIEKTTAFRYASFSMGTFRDDIFEGLIKNRIGRTIRPRTDYVDFAFDVPKQMEISLFSQMVNPDGSTINAPAGGGEGCLNVSCTQLQPTRANDSYYAEHHDLSDVKRLIHDARSDNWFAKRGDGTGAYPAGSVLPNWAAFTGCDGGGTGAGALRIRINNADTYTFHISIEHCANFTANPPVWAEGVNIVKTGTTRGPPPLGGGGNFKMQSYMKSRFFPLHPTVSMLPATTEAKNIIYLASIGTSYPPRATSYANQQGGGRVNNYQANIGFMVDGVDQLYSTPQNVFAPSDAAGGAQFSGIAPQIMLKTRKIRPHQVVPGPIAPPSSGQILISDLQPATQGDLYNASLHSVMYIQVGGGLTQFPGNSAPKLVQLLDTFVVEAKNLPVKGFLSKGFPFGQANAKVGSGQRKAIIGVVPSIQQLTDDADVADNKLAYIYRVPYPQPVHLRLPTSTFFYHLDLELRSVLSGQLLENLLNSTEVMLRIIPLPD